MLKILNQIDYGTLIILSIVMALIPFTPMPHLLEKLIMLKDGVLRKPIDIFDLFFHLIPTILLIIKFVGNRLESS